MRLPFFALVVVTAAAQSTDQTGGISGVVTDAVTRLPVKKTMVSAQPLGDMAGRTRTPAAATTDASGAFAVTDLQAGKYRLMFQHQNYPQARFGGVVKTIEVKAGESAGPLNIELMPGAAVSGHIVDEDGDPLPGCFVQIHPAKNPEQGSPIMGNSSSNQDGEWRAFGIAAGKYVLLAQCGHAVFQARPLSAGPDPAPSRAYPVQYYPLAGDNNGAQAVELTAGNEKSGVDFQMSPTAVTQVHGAFAPGGADWRGANQMVIQLSSPAQRGMNQGAAPNLEKGTFDFRQVFPGSYFLVAFSQGAEDNRIGAWQRVDVSDKPLELMLELKRAVDLAGKVEIESSGNSTNKLTPGQVYVNLVPQFQIGMPGSQTQVGEDGTFTLKGVMPAPWRLRVGAPMAFLKSVWIGSTDVTNAPLDLSGGAAGPLRIVVSANTATIRGSAPVGMMIFASRIDEDNFFQGNMVATADQSGQYSLAGLAPGKYRLIVSENGGPPPDEGGQEVTVREGETVMADLKAPSNP